MFVCLCYFFVMYTILPCLWIVHSWFLLRITLYIYCILVREIWKFIHPRLSYSLRETHEGNMILEGEYIFLFPEPACYKCCIIPNETKKTHIGKILLANIFSIGTLSQILIFKNNIVTVACKWCVPSTSDVFLSKNDNSSGKTSETSEVVEYDIYFTEYDFCPVWSCVLIFTYCPIKLIYLR